ncbi:MAG: DUF4040 domain-containing protein [Solirubrobacterales bacterium]|nr:DUF4040 domain-containing protein [Solirubrobacterales bacterium]
MLQTVMLVLVILSGTAVALISEPLHQVLVLAIYGFALTLLFFCLQAPDVALSELVVSGVGLPLIILATLRKLAERRDREDA